MENSVEQALEAVPFCFGQILVRKTGDDFVLCHRDDEAHDDLEIFQGPEDAIEIARYDDAGNYRALKTAPNLRHGWRMELRTSDWPSSLRGRLVGCALRRCAKRWIGNPGCIV